MPRPGSIADVDRLIAWYRIGSSVGAVASLVLANLVPLIGVLWLGWSVWTILIVYWLENGVVGAFNVLKIARAAGPEPTRPDSVVVDGRKVILPAQPVAAGRSAIIGFFIVHYGMFWLVHGIFVLTLPLFAGIHQDGSGEFVGLVLGPFLVVGGVAGAVEPLSPVGPAPDLLQLVVVLVFLAISHGISYKANFIGRGEYLRVSPSQQAMAPYGRLLVLHITIIFGGIAIAFTGASIAAVVVLVLLKIALDLGFHLAEHREIEGTSAVT